MIKKENYIIVGNGIYTECGVCKRLVRINKFLFGDLHICLSNEEIEEKKKNRLKKIKNNIT